MSKQTNTSGSDRISETPVVDYIFKILAAITVPLFIWGINLNSDVAVLEGKVARSQAQLAEFKKEMNKRGNDTAELQLSFARLEIKLGTANERLQEIKQILDRRRSSGYDGGN